jgi:hypothetical protein
MSGRVCAPALCEPRPHSGLSSWGQRFSGFRNPGQRAVARASSRLARNGRCANRALARHARLRRARMRARDGCAHGDREQTLEDFPESLLIGSGLMIHAHGRFQSCALVLIFALSISACGSSSGGSNSGANTSAPTTCCVEMSGLCLCGPLPAGGPSGSAGCADLGMATSCTGTYSCCGLSQAMSPILIGEDCSCASDSFLSSINETCSQWLTSGDGGTGQKVPSCPQK